MKYVDILYNYFYSYFSRECPLILLLQLDIGRCCVGSGGWPEIVSDYLVQHPGSTLYSLNFKLKNNRIFLDLRMSPKRLVKIKQSLKLQNLLYFVIGIIIYKQKKGIDVNICVEILK